MAAGGVNRARVVAGRTFRVGQHTDGSGYAYLHGPCTGR